MSLKCLSSEGGDHVNIREYRASGSSMMRLVNTIGMLFALSCLMGCGGNDNGFEGDVFLRGTRLPAAGVEVIAKTTSDIKEEQDQLVRKTSADAQGHFVIKDLLPENTYEIIAGGPGFWSPSQYDNRCQIVALETGTRCLNSPLYLLPSPPPGTICRYNPVAGTLDTLNTLAIPMAQSIRLEGFYYLDGNPRGDDRPLDAFYIQAEDVQRSSLRISATDFIMFDHSQLRKIVPLRLIEKDAYRGDEWKMGSDGYYRTDPYIKIAIPLGWYYGIESFQPNRLSTNGLEFLTAHERRDFNPARPAGGKKIYDIQSRSRICGDDVQADGINWAIRLPAGTYLLEVFQIPPMGLVLNVE